MSNKNIIPIEINEENLNSLIYIFRGKQVMLDADLAAIYGYSTKDFNRQVKNNIERFDEEDLMFQLTNQELSNLRCKIFTSSSKDRWGGRRYGFTIVVPLQKMAATRSRQLPCLKKMASTIH